MHNGIVEAIFGQPAHILDGTVLVSYMKPLFGIAQVLLKETCEEQHWVPIDNPIDYYILCRFEATLHAVTDCVMRMFEYPIGTSRLSIL
ncbi:hypothetical protein CHUAL_011401 [Chamberlinius hualienensis]